MRFTAHATLLFVALALLDPSAQAAAKKPSRSSSTNRRSSSRHGQSRMSNRPPVSKRRHNLEFEDEEEGELGFPDELLDDDDDFEEDDDDFHPRSRRPPHSRQSPPRKPGSPNRAPSSRNNRYMDEEDDVYERPRRPSRSRKHTSRRGPPPSRRSDRSGRVVPYGRNPGPSTFTRGLTVLKNSMPDPSAVREAAVNSLNVAREATSGLSANLYREVKGLTSSELEQVMLKATRPDDTAVKGKHVERLVGVTYQISSRYDIYDAVLRKLWAKMAEKDWRTTIKALYILHRFSADGAPEHAPALKARLRELRRTRDPKRKEKYFNSKQLLAGENKPESAKFRAFMSRYAHYVLLRAQCFGGLFEEISSIPPKKDKKSGSTKPVTSTSLRTEHLEAAKLLLKAGVACQMKNGEECENTAIAVERVASDLIGLTSSVAMALNRALKDENIGSANLQLIKQWCEFYGEALLPETRAMVKRTTPKLDAYGLFLPSRMGATLSEDTLKMGLKLGSVETDSESSVEGEGSTVETDATIVTEDGGNDEIESEEVQDDEALDEGLEDEYEYEEEEYYDDEEPF